MVVRASGGCLGWWQSCLVSCEGMVFGQKLGVVVAIMVCFLMDVVDGFNYRWAGWLVELPMVRGDLLLISNANRKIDLIFFLLIVNKKAKETLFSFFDTFF